MFDLDDSVTAALQTAWRSAAKKYLHRENVVGVAIGYRWKGGIRQKRLCVRVHVAEKIGTSALTSADLLPRRQGNIILDVVGGQFQPIMAGTCNTFGVRTARAQAVQPGFSVGPLAGDGGTIGALVRARIAQR